MRTLLYVILLSLFFLPSCKKESNDGAMEGDGMQAAGDTVITNAETEAVGHTADSVDIQQHLDSINNLPQ